MTAGSVQWVFFLITFSPLFRVCLNLFQEGYSPPFLLYIYSCTPYPLFHIFPTFNTQTPAVSQLPNMTIVEMRVHMDCPGCESKIRKALQKLDGIDDIDVDIGMQKVTVMGWADQEKVLKTVRKTGRKAELWPYPYNPAEYYNYSNEFYQKRHRDRYHQSFPVTYYTESQSPSSYNYYQHGYSGHDHGYYHQPLHSTTIGEKAEALFSDDNPNACSIM